MRRRTFLLGAALLGACGLPTGDLIVYPADAPELDAASVTPEGQWQSAPWTGSPWLPFPGRATVQLEHGLDHAPTAVLVYLSFDEDGSDPALAAGDLARVIAVEESTLSIRNDTSAFFFARVVAF